MKSRALATSSARRTRRSSHRTAERDRFVSTVVHELRTPLAHVRLVLDTVRMARSADESARDAALGIADREVLRLQHLVDGILRLTGRAHLSCGSRIALDVVQEALAVVRDLAPVVRSSGVVLRVIGDTSAPVRARSGAIRQALINLLDNAVKYGPTNGLVTIEVSRQGTGGVRVAVSDNGPGVPRAERQRIWQPFVRGGVAERSTIPGSGIGLSVVRDIATEHGGRAWVEDAAGGGARFVLDLPCPDQP